MKNKYIKRNNIYSKAIQKGKSLWLSGHIANEFIAVLEDMNETLLKAKYSATDIGKVTVYLRVKNQHDFNRLYGVFNTVYEKWCKKCGIAEDNMPARTVVGVLALPKDSLVEVEAYAQK